jgi:hypothetical protein
MILRVMAWSGRIGIKLTLEVAEIHPAVILGLDPRDQSQRGKWLELTLSPRAMILGTSPRMTTEGRPVPALTLPS